MRMSVVLFRSKSNVDFIWFLNSKSFHIRDGESEVHINIRTDEFMLRPRLLPSGIWRSLSKWEQRHNISDRHPAKVTLLPTTSMQKTTWWGYGIESVSSGQGIRLQGGECLARLAGACYRMRVPPLR